MNQYKTIEQQLSLVISEALKQLYGIDTEQNISITPTKKDFEGDYTFVVFPFLKYSHKSPEETAKELGETLLKNDKLVKGYNVVKGFLNLLLQDNFFTTKLEEMLEVKNYGKVAPSPSSQLYMVEYSSPNTNKPLHLGHVRNNLLGYSISKILEANGKRVVKTNIVNDRGIHICKSMLAWEKWGNGVTPESSGKKGDHLVGDFYVLFDKHYKAEIEELQAQGLTKEEAEKKSPLMQEARSMLQKWEKGDQKVRELWAMMNEWVYTGFDETYKRMGVSFDKIYYESDTYLVGKEEVLRGLNEGLFVKDTDGSVWADLTKEGYDRKLLLRADGTSVYITQDIGTAKLRFEDYPIDQMIYVVGNEQDYHFQVLSLILDKLGYSFGRDLKHFSYGMVELPDGKMKSREGTVVDADELMDQMVETALTVSTGEGRTVEMSEEERYEMSRRVGLGALKYFLLKVEPKKNMLFDPKESIDFNGNTGPFIQYTYARIQSVLRKHKNTDVKTNDTDTVELQEKEIALIKRLNEFGSVICSAGEELNPSAIANYAYDLGREFNQFYHEHSILNEPNTALLEMRIKISRLTGYVLKESLQLLGIEMPERM